MGWKGARRDVLRNSITSRATALRRAMEAVAYAIVAALIMYFAIVELGVVYGLLVALAVALLLLWLIIYLEKHRVGRGSSTSTLTGRAAGTWSMPPAPTWRERIKQRWLRKSRTR